jgi:tRNA1(Val) A37 N6-methylase TrmN6
MLARGIIRSPRRPPGWVAPGPSPGVPPIAAGPRDGEDLCYLAGDWRILQRLDGHRWSLDDLVTAWVACSETEHAPPARFADLGCGIGAVLMLVAWRFPAARGVGVEAQAVSVDLARRSLAWNGIAGRCEVRCADLRDPTLLAGAGFDLVTATPPYLTPGTATEPVRVQQAGCHFEHRGGIEAYAVAAARCLAPGGRFVTCAAAAQRDRVRAAAAAAGLAVERRLDVIPRAGKPVLFAVYALRRAAEVARTTVAPPLVVRDARGRWTEAFAAVRRQMGMPPSSRRS